MYVCTQLGVGPLLSSGDVPEGDDPRRKVVRTPILQLPSSTS